MTASLFDAVGVKLAPGQRVLYAAAGLRASGALQPGIVVRAYLCPFGGGENIVIQRDEDRKHIVIRWSRRVVVLAQPQETEATHDARTTNDEQPQEPPRTYEAWKAAQWKRRAAEIAALERPYKLPERAANLEDERRN